MGKWNGIMRIVELNHIDALGRTMRTERNILNTVHILGEDLILRALFAGGPVPVEYHLGLDSRPSINASDDISDISGLEPTSNGYARQTVANDGFAIVAEGPSSIQARSPTMLFTASGGPWPAIRNIFMSTGPGYSSPTVLVSSASIGQEIVVSEGETISMRLALSLSGC